MLEVLFISTYESLGGAARATRRIFESLKSLPIVCKLFTASKMSQDDHVHQMVCLGDKEKLRYAHDLLSTIRAQHAGQSLSSFGQASAGIVDAIQADSAAIVHLHWVCNYLSVQDIAQIRKPIIWTLHDMWPLSGCEHYTYDLDAFFYSNAVGNPVETSQSFQLFKEKVEAWAKQNFTIVTPSKWLAECARKSVLFHSSDIHVIPYPIDTSFWSPQNPLEARKNFHFDSTKVQILFIGQNMLNDPTKGWDLLRESLQKLALDSDLDFELILAGHDGDLPQDLPFSVLSLGIINNDLTLVQLYSAVHILAMPSRAEAFSLVTCEAQACGLPVIGFEIGGIPDIVIHQKTGWIARPFDTSDFAHGMQWVLSDQERRMEMGVNARRSVVENFSEEVVSRKYLDLYEVVAKSATN